MKNPTLKLSLILLMLAIGVVVGSKAFALPATHTQTALVDCTLTDKLVNPCRPLLGGFSFESGGLIADIEGRNNVAVALEPKTGKRVEVVRAYIPKGKWAINKESKYFIDRPNTILFTNYKPAMPWRDSDGRNELVNSQIDQMAESIKANVPNGKKIMLSLDAEPEDDMSSLDSETQAQCPDQTFRAKTQSGNPAEYRAMWRNVRDRFDAAGASDKVVWVMNYMGFEKWDCVVKALYPGDDLVDWVAWDPYVSGETSWDQDISRFYTLLEKLTDETHQFTAKPWALPEFGSWHSSQDKAYQMYSDARVAVETNRYPRIKLYSIFDATGVRSSKIEYVGTTTQKDAQELAAYSQFAQSPAFTNPLHETGVLPNNLTYRDEAKTQNQPIY